MRQDTQINVVQGDVGEQATVTQIYAPGQRGFEAEVLPHAPNLPVFSPEWLQFFQESVPLIGREEEIAALEAFLQADASFLWWGVYGPAGIGKSRLAHELVRLHPDWEGGFLAADRSTIGAASAWQPAGNALWIVDYAAGRAEAVARMLCVLARRFARSSTKVRVLLLERNAGVQAGWWRNLMQQAGHQRVLLQRSLHRDPLELGPLGESAPHVLIAWLAAGGKTAAEAYHLAASVTRDVLALATANGRPLLLGLVAAGMHRGTFDPGRRAMPDDCLDDYLSRELRHMAEQSTQHDFGQACLTLFDATLVGGKPAFTALRARTPEPPQGEQLLAMQRALNLLASRGISERSDWALRPDALGERFIEVMAIRTPAVVERYAVLPPYDADMLGYVISQEVQHMGNGLITLARMPDASVRALLALSLQHGMTMRSLLITLKYLALHRGAPLHSDYASLLQAKCFGPLHIAKVETFVRAGFAYAAGNAALAELQGCLDPEHDADLAVWLVPFIVTITALDGVRLHRLCIWYADMYPRAQVRRVRELVLAAKLLDQLASGLIPDFKRAAQAQALMRLWTAETAAFGDALCKAIVKLYKSIEQNFLAVLDVGSNEDAEEIASAMSTASVQLSFVLLRGGSMLAEHLDGRLWLTAAAGVAGQGVGWAQRAQAVRDHSLCVRNLLAAANSLDPTDEKRWEARWARMRQCAQNGAQQDWTELAVDAVRIAALAGRIEPACRVVAEALACTDWLEGAIIPLLDEDEHFSRLIELDLQAQGWAGAIACFRAYTDMLHPLALDRRALPGAILGMVEMLALNGAVRGREALLELCQLLESLFDSAAPESPKSMLAASAMARIAIYCLHRGEPPPFKCLSFEVVSPTPVLSAQQLAAIGSVPDNLQTIVDHAVRATSPEIPGYERHFVLCSSSYQPLAVEGDAPSVDAGGPA